MTNTTKTRTATITRRSMIDGRPFTRTVYLVRQWDHIGTGQGEAWIVTNAPGHSYEIHELIAPDEFDN